MNTKKPVSKVLLLVQIFTPAAELEYIIEDVVLSADNIAVDPIYPEETYF